MEKSKKKKPNLFRYHSPRINKIITALFSAIVMIGGAGFIICILQLISSAVSEPGMDIASLFIGFDIFMELLFAIFLLCAIAFGTAYLYNYLINKGKYEETKEVIEVKSPLVGYAAEHQEQIIELLKSIARPTGDKQYLNRAPTGQFLRALTELGYMDANITGPNLMAWVEMVTEYKDKDKDSSHFFAAYNKPTKDDYKVIGYMQQIKQIVGQ